MCSLSCGLCFTIQHGVKTTSDLTVPPSGVFKKQDFEKKQQQNQTASFSPTLMTATPLSPIDASLVVVFEQDGNGVRLKCIKSRPSFIKPSESYTKGPEGEKIKQVFDLLFHLII